MYQYVITAFLSSSRTGARNDEKKIGITYILHKSNKMILCYTNASLFIYRLINYYLKKIGR